MKDLILQSVNDVVRASMLLKEPVALQFIEKSAELMADAIKKGHKILIAGNGGSLCDAMHFAEELTGIFRQKRPALPAIALADPGHMSCVGNDLGFDSVFSRGVEALGSPGDVFVALTTSGKSVNLLNALSRAKQLGLSTVAFLGKTGGSTKGIADLEWIVSGFDFSDRIQEVHMAAIHIIIEMIEQHLFAYASR